MCDLKKEIKLFNKSFQSKNKLLFINNRLLLLDQKYINHYMFFKKLQIILYDLPSIIYCIKKEFIKCEEENIYEHKYYFNDSDDENNEDDYFFLKTKEEKYVLLKIQKSLSQYNNNYYSFSLNTKYGTINLGNGDYNDSIKYYTYYDENNSIQSLIDLKYINIIYKKLNIKNVIKKLSLLTSNLY